MPFFLEFDALQTEPALEKFFLETGGAINAAAARGSTDFALTGSQHSTVHMLSDSQATVVRLKIPEEHVATSTTAKNTIQMDNRAKLLLCASRDGAAINGSVVSTVSGQAAVYLSAMLRSSAQHAAIPLTYAAWKAHSAVVSLSAFRIVDDQNRRFDVEFICDQKLCKVLEAAEAYVGSWAEGAWALRQNGLIYPYSPALSKSVGKQPCGINDSKFDLVHNLIETPTAHFSNVTVESLLKRAIENELEFVDEEIEVFALNTKHPGIAAAAHGRTVAAAMSTLAAFLVSYRADGRTSIQPQSSVAVAAESWLRQAPRSATEANDCDGSAITILNLIGACTRSPSAENLRAQHLPYMASVRNVIVPYFTPGIGVLGASSAEASGGGGDHGKHPKTLAGHAAALLVPSMDLLRALNKGAAASISGTEAPIVEADKHDAVAEARFTAIFSPSVLETLPRAEAEALVSWREALYNERATVYEEQSTGEAVDAQVESTLFGLTSKLTSFGMEGTTPASPILFTNQEAAISAAASAAKDQKVFDKIGPSVARSVKILYAANPRTGEHRFYHDIVEFTVARSHPLWSNKKVRDLGVASSQFVFSTHVDDHTALSTAGVSPKDLVTQSYAAVPLVVVNTEEANVLDFASQAADQDVMPLRRPEDLKLSQFQSDQLKRSLASLESLHADLSTKDPEAEGHAVAYVLAFSTLVSNPVAVEHFSSRIKETASAGVVDALDVEGLMTDVEGKQAGKLVVVNVVA